MARLFRAICHLLPPLLLLLLLTITTATGNQLHRPRRRRHTPTTPPAAAAAAASASPAKCDDPPEAELKARLREEGSLHESFYQHQALRGVGKEILLDKFQKMNRGPVDIRLASLDTSSKRQDCTPIKRPTDQGDFLDPCPITWVLNYDPNRVPKVMVEGQCLNCSHCASSSGNSSQPASVEVGSEVTASDISSCRKVSYYTRVLRKTNKPCVSNKYIYDLVWEPITVGCACMGGPYRVPSISPPPKPVPPS